jgi:hypothetical protein
MSMPSTCTDKVVSNAHFVPRAATRTANLLQLFFCPINADEVREWTLRSIDSLRRQFFCGQNTAQVDCLTRAVARLPHRPLLAVFLLLLNIDDAAKQRLMQSDAERNQWKLARFFVDLKHEAVSRFFATEEVSVLQFVDLCEELYVIA